MATWYARNSFNAGVWSSGNQTQQPITGPQASVTLVESSEIISFSGLVRKDVATHIIKDSGGAVLPDGIFVIAFLASSMGGTPIVQGSGVIGNVNVGIGEVQIECLNTSPVVLIPNHADATFPTGEVGHSPPITPLSV